MPDGSIQLALALDAAAQALPRIPKGAVRRTPVETTRVLRYLSGGAETAMCQAPKVPPQTKRDREKQLSRAADARLLAAKKISAVDLARRNGFLASVDYSQVVILGPAGARRRK